MWEIRHLRAFLTVARLGSFTKAARFLHLSQPALTVQVRQLEEALGTRLLDRGPRSVRLTAIGKELAATLEPAISDLDAVLSRTREWIGGARGSVSIACLPSVAAGFLPEAIAAFKREHPAIKVQIRDLVAEGITDLVRSEEVDFGIGMLGARHPDLTFLPLFVDRMSAVFRSGHALEGRTKVTLGSLRSCELLLTDTRSSVRNIIDDAYASLGHRVTPAYEATSVSTIIAMAKAGLGVAIAPSSMLEDKLVDGLKAREIADAALVREIGIIQRSGRSLSPPSERFVDLLRASKRTAPSSKKRVRFGR
jgi:LysR family transcriptional regulator, carnitine catabolism transcriptional activator